MTHVVRPTDAQRLDLPGRTSYEIVSAARTGATVTLRKVEIPPAQSHVARGQHRHTTFEECIYVLSGRGMTTTADGEVEVGAGDTILVPRPQTAPVGGRPIDGIALLQWAANVIDAIIDPPADKPVS